MDNKGYIATVGEFYEDDSILYSNYSYIGYTNYGYSWDDETRYLPISTSDKDNWSRYDSMEIYLEAIGLLEYEIETLFKRYTISELENELYSMDVDDILELVYI